MALPSSKIKKFLKFQEMKLRSFEMNRILLRKWSFPASYFSYILGGNFLNSKKKTQSEKISYISVTGTF